MRERSIAEIIGWVDTGAWGWHPPMCPRLSDRRWLESSTCHHASTVDDLLAWLAGDMFFNVEIVRADGYVSVGFVNTDSGLDDQIFDGATLLAALEAAVRAVDSSLASGSPEAEVEAAPSPAAPTSRP